MHPVREPHRTDKHDAPDSLLALHDLRSGEVGTIAAVAPGTSQRDVEQRLACLGFRVGRRVRMIATGPFGGAPWAVEVAGRIFALRRHEAGRILLVRG